MNGYNFTDRVRRVLALARESAIERRYEYVGTEHLLLGLLREGNGIAVAVLERCAIEPAEVSKKLLDALDESRSSAGLTDLPYTSRAMKVIELAMSEARAMHHDHLGSEHLLLGLLAEEKGIAAQVLRACGLTLERARVETLRVVGEGPKPRKRPMDDVESGLTSIAIEARFADGSARRAELPSQLAAIRFLVDL